MHPVCAQNKSLILNTAYWADTCPHSRPTNWTYVRIVRTEQWDTSLCNNHDLDNHIILFTAIMIVRITKKETKSFFVTYFLTQVPKELVYLKTIPYQARL